MSQHPMLRVLPVACRIAACFGSALLLFANVFADVAKVDGDALQQLIDQGVPVIDVRRSDEWATTGVLEGSHLLTFFDKQGKYDVESWLASLDKVVEKDQPFVLICAVGGRTATISRFLDTRLGYKNVYDAGGGIRRWIKSGRSVVEIDKPGIDKPGVDKPEASADKAGSNKAGEGSD